MKQQRKSACYIACTRSQKAAIERLATKDHLSISAYLSRRLGRKFWIEIDNEVLRIRHAGTPQAGETG